MSGRASLGTFSKSRAPSLKKLIAVSTSPIARRLPISPHARSSTASRMREASPAARRNSMLARKLTPAIEALVSSAARNVHGQLAKLARQTSQRAPLRHALDRAQAFLKLTLESLQLIGLFAVRF